VNPLIWWGQRVRDPRSLPPRFVIIEIAVSSR
jgi:hypothetical protein